MDLSEGQTLQPDRIKLALLSRIAYGLVLSALLLGAQEDPRELIKQAEANLDAGRYSIALEKALGAAALLPAPTQERNRARALTTAGLARMYSGDYLPAIENFGYALAVAIREHDFASEIARRNDLGNARYFQGRYSDSMDQYQQAMRRVEAVPNDRWSGWGRQVTTANIAILYQTLGQFDRALALYSGLLSSSLSMPAQEQAQLLTNIGALRRRLGDPRKALDTYREAQSLYAKATHRDGEIAVLNNIGIVYALDLGDFRAATASFSSALVLAEKSGDRPLALHARLYRGEAYYRAGLLRESTADFTLALDTARALGAKEEEWKALYGLARLAATQGDSSGARQLLISAVTVIEALREKAGGASLRAAFLADKRDVYDLLIENSSDAGEVFHWMEQSRARTLRDRFGSKPILTLSQFAHALPVGTGALEYWIGARTSAVLWVSQSQTGIKRWSTGDKNANELILASLYDPKAGDWRTAMRPLARQLLESIPVLEDWKLHRLIIIPDGALARLPFEALPDSETTLLLQRFAVSYLPAASLLSKGTPAHLSFPWQASVTAFADPAPGMVQPGSEMETRSWLRLPEARTEVTAIAQSMGGRSALYIGENAQKQWLSKADRYPVLHFASHAVANLQTPELSYVLLAPDQPSRQYDYLFLNEIYALRLSNVALVSLSACETSAGKLVPGEGIEGLSEGFLGAGARSVVASLWSVGDRPASQLMQRFYDRLSHGAAMDEALREVKLEFLTHPQSAHPAYWAAFVLSGSGDSHLPRVIHWTWIGIAAVSIIFAALAVMARPARNSKIP